jgi:hypothetical protein
MKSKLVLIAALTLLAVPISSAAAARQPIDPRTVPLGIDRTVLGPPTDGPIAATGRLVDARGRNAHGHIALLAWPNQRVNRTLGKGASFSTPTVGWADTGEDGSFEVRLDRTRLGKNYVGRNGTVNLLAIGWTDRAEGSWSFSANVDDATARSTGRRRVPASFTLAAKDALTSRKALSDRGVRLDGGASPQFSVPCYWVVLATHDVMVVVGEGWPYGADRSYMKSSSSHSETLGVAVSSSGTFGSWSPNGTTVSSAGVTFTWAESTAFRDYRDQHRYATMRQRCGSTYVGNYYEKEQYPTGGYGNGAIYPYPYWSYCAPVPIGLWERSSSNGNHYHQSIGVKLAPIIGINLSSDSNYDSSHILYLRLTANGMVCGNDAVPSLASKVESSR